MHLEFIYRVVDNLFQQHIDTVFSQRAITQSAYIHTRTQSNMLRTRKCTDILVTIVYLLLGNNQVVVVCHYNCFL